MDVESQKNVLLDAIQQQYQDNVAATEANRKLADEKISYANEAKGTYYSGIPTWQRAQNAAVYAEKMSDLNKGLMTAQESVWKTVSDYLDKISAYNEAAKNNNNTSKSKSGYPLSAYYSSEHGYQFVDDDGNPIRANTWATRNGKDIWSVLTEMAANGDQNAKIALGTQGKSKDQLTPEEKSALGILGL